MKTIRLSPETTHIRFDELPHLIAFALHPLGENPSDVASLTYGGARLNLEDELNKAVEVGALPVKDPLRLGPHSVPVGAMLKTALVRVVDLAAFVADRGLSVTTEEPANESPSRVKYQVHH